MARTKLAEPGEFAAFDNSVMHMPTKATFFAYPGEVTINSHIPVHLGCMLPNGDDYDADSVWKIARKLIAERSGAHA